MTPQDITVVIPAFNSADTIMETLSSIAAQSLAPARTIIVDDGSTDGTALIAKTHPLRPRIVAQANTGAATAIDRGIELAETPLLAFLDADDLWLPDKLELQVAALDDDRSLDVVLGHVENFICPSVLTADAQRLPADAKPRPGYLIGCMLVRRASFMRVGKLNADLRTGYFIDWWSRAMDAGLQYLMLSETTLRRRLRPNTLSFRSDRETDQIGKDALTIARAAILRRRQRAAP